MRSYEGEIVVEGVDFWAWVTEQLTFDEEDASFNDPEFENDTLYIRWCNAVRDEGVYNTQEIDMVEFWTWLLTSYLPDSGDEILFDEPKWDSEEQVLSVKYAGSDTCHPSTWSKPPSFLRKELKGWKDYEEKYGKEHTEKLRSLIQYERLIDAVKYHRSYSKDSLQESRDLLVALKEEYLRERSRS